jgi:hypothetical protein
METRPSVVPLLGFLTVVEHEPFGLFGGYLLLTPTGRPVEFHVTAPVKPSRAQELLYGPTLREYVYGEQIGQALVAKASRPAEVILTDQPPVLAVADFAAAPVSLVLASAEASTPGLAVFAAGVSRLGVERHRTGEDEVRRRLAGCSGQFDFLEPFGRIRGAIEEAQRSGR